LRSPWKIFLREQAASRVLSRERLLTKLCFRHSKEIAATERGKIFRWTRRDPRPLSTNRRSAFSKSCNTGQRPPAYRQARSVETPTVPSYSRDRPRAKHPRTQVPNSAGLCAAAAQSKTFCRLRARAER